MAQEYTVTVPDDQAEWLDDQPHLDPSGLLQKAIQDQQRLEPVALIDAKRHWLEEVEREKTHDSDAMTDDALDANYWSDEEHIPGPDPNASNDDALEVKKAYPNDSGRGIIRVDPDTLLEINADPGDVLEITGRATTAGKVWRADRQDWDTSTTRIDGFTRHNAEIGIGEHITIQKAETKQADQVILTSPDEAKIQFNTDAADMIQRQLLKRPLVENDVVPVMSSSSHSFMRSPGQAIPLIADETVLNGVVVITEETTVELRE